MSDAHLSGGSPGTRCWGLAIGLAVTALPACGALDFGTGLGASSDDGWGDSWTQSGSVDGIDSPDDAGDADAEGDFGEGGSGAAGSEQEGGMDDGSGTETGSEATTGPSASAGEVGQDHDSGADASASSEGSESTTGTGTEGGEGSDSSASHEGSDSEAEASEGSSEAGSSDDGDDEDADGSDGGADDDGDDSDLEYELQLIDSDPTRFLGSKADATVHNDFCPAGKLLTGLEGYYDDDLLLALRGRCSWVKYEADAFVLSLSPAGFTPWRGPRDADEGAWKRHCPPGEAVADFGLVVAQGIRGLRVGCAPLELVYDDQDKPVVELGDVRSLENVGLDVGLFDDVRCIEGDFPAGATLAESKRGLYGVGLECRTAIFKPR